MITYPQFLIRHGIRRSEKITSPKLSIISQMELPPNSVVHFVPEDEVSFGPTPEEPYIKTAKQVVLVDTVERLTSTLGNPRPAQFLIGKMVMDYHRRYRRTRPLKDPKVIDRDPRALLVYNYAGLQHAFRYMPTLFSVYHKWYNIQATMWNKVAEVAKGNRMQYVFLTAPDQLPSVPVLKQVSERISQEGLKKIRTQEGWALLELWKWLGDNRQSSMLSVIPQELLGKINVVFRDHGRWTFINLGLLDKWRVPSPSELKAGVKRHPGIEYQDLQKRLLRMFMAMQEARVEVGLPPDETIQTAQQMIDEMDEDAISIAEDIQKEEAAELGITNAPVVTRMSAAELEQLSKDSQFDINSKELDFNETEVQGQAIASTVDRDVAVLEEVAVKQEVLDEQTEKAAAAPAPRDAESAAATATVTGPMSRRESLVQGIAKKAERQAVHGRMSAAEMRRFRDLSTGFERIPDPFGREGTIADHLTYTPEQLKLEPEQLVDYGTILDKSMEKSTVGEFERRYVREFYKSDILNAVMNVQKAGVAVTSYEVEVVEDAMNHYQIHTVKLSPVDGKSSTLRFRVPELADDGSYVANGVKARLCKQRGDMPIRKVSPFRVSLTSYASKLSVTRSQQVKYDYNQWVANKITAMGLDKTNAVIEDMRGATVFNSHLKMPRPYSQMAMRFRSFRHADYLFYFDHGRRYRVFGAEAVDAAEKKTGMVVAGRKGGDTGPLLLMDEAGTLYTFQGEDDLQPAGTIESIIGLDTSKAPREIVELQVFNKDLPIGIILGYQLGLTATLARLNLVPRRVPRGERIRLEENEFALQFADESLIFVRDGSVGAMLMAGFLPFAQSIRNYSVYTFDAKDIYFTVLENNGIGVRYLREVEQLTDMWIDPITMELLESMGEPTDFLGLLMRATELLTTDWTPDETALSQMRIKGNERISGTIYKELYAAVRSFKSRPGATGGVVELNPYAVWVAINTDGAVRLIEEANPIHNIKEGEEVTYMGTGGRSGRSMVKRTRIFHQEDMGTISEATKDSGEVGVTVSMTADPNLNSMRGTTRRYNPEVDGPATLISTSAMLAPSADRDDPKRTNFVSIQNSQGISSVGYQVPPLRTGYDQVVAHRTGDMFAATAEKNGKVLGVTENSILVEYEDGTQVSVELGRRFGKAAGAVVPHMLVTDFKTGDTVKPSDVIAYNKNWFVPDQFNPGNVILKSAVLANYAILESTDTFEDSSVISQSLADRLLTHTTHIRDIVLDFSQTVTGLTNIGQAVDVETILCTIEEAVTANNRLFDAETTASLSLLSSQSPRSKYHGSVERIEVFYNGEIEDMSESLAAITAASDRRRKAYFKSIGKSYISGRVDDSLRLNNNPLLMDQLVIRVYITGPVPVGVGDKGVVANQLKTIFGRIMHGTNETVSGQQIDGFFAYEGIAARIVNSPIDIGTTNTLAAAASLEMAQIYMGTNQ